MNIKLLCVYHKPAILWKSDIVCPIHAGRALLQQQVNKHTLTAAQAQWLTQQMPGDNTGEHISDLNPYLNEATVIYWAWKNYETLGNPDYIGLMHYRRQFWFKTHLNAADYLSAIGCTQADIEQAMKGYEMACIHLSGERNLNDHMQEMHADSLWQDALRVLQETDPEHFSAYEKIAKTDLLNAMRNMFIFSRAEFFRYCEWLFKIVLTLKDRSAHFYEGRSAGYVVEALTTLYIERFITEGKPVLQVNMLYEQDLFATTWSRKLKFLRRYIAVRVVSEKHKKYHRYVRFEQARQIRNRFFRPAQLKFCQEIKL